jgi:hypothetical protein
MRWAGALRRELSARNQQIAVLNGSLHELTGGEMPRVIFGRNESCQHGNFSIPPHIGTFAPTRNGHAGSPRSTPHRAAHGPERPGDGGNWIARTAQTRCS